MAKRSDSGLQPLGNILEKIDFNQKKYISREFQDFGYRLAEELGDLKSKSLYMKLAKEEPRGLLEAAASFVKDAPNVKSRPRLFMWKLAQLKKGDRK